MISHRPITVNLIGDILLMKKNGQLEIRFCVVHHWSNLCFYTLIEETIIVVKMIYRKRFTPIQYTHGYIMTNSQVRKWLDFFLNITLWIIHHFPTTMSMLILILITNEKYSRNFLVALMEAIRREICVSHWYNVSLHGFFFSNDNKIKNQIYDKLQPHFLMQNFPLTIPHTPIWIIAALYKQCLLYRF